MNRSLDWTSYTDCSVTSVRHACLFTTYSYMLVLISVIVHNINRFVLHVAKYLRIILEGSTA